MPQRRGGSQMLAIFNTDLLVAMIRLSTPITLAAIGATICERSGIVNIAMEGIMIVGAFFATVVAYYTGSPWLGLLAGVLAGGLYSMIHAVATVTFHLEHVVSGAVLNVLAFGITRYFMVLFSVIPGPPTRYPKGLANTSSPFPFCPRSPYWGLRFSTRRPSSI